MTEKEAWLELAKIFEPGRPALRVRTDYVPSQPVDGICWGIEYLHQKDTIDSVTDDAMDNRLYSFFRPENFIGGYFWRKGLGQPRATACGFLAAMCDD